MNDTKFSSTHGATWTNHNFEDETSMDYKLPSDLTEISDSSLLGVFFYCVVFIVAILGHKFALYSLWKRYKEKKSRIYFLLIHLSLADLIVCLVFVPTEIFWRLSVQWEGGNFVCKLIQFLRAFGLYLSSLVLVSLTMDRFISIISPPNLITRSVPSRRVNWMILISWIAAAIFSTPQAVLFKVEFHPRFPNYKQCVTSAFEDEENFEYVKIYSVFSLTVMYIFPLLVILFTYTVICLKLTVISHELTRSQLQTDSQFSGNFVPTVVGNDGVVSSVHANLSRAKIQTLWMTVLIICAFIVCWTPYAIMTLWYIVDWEEAEQIDERIQDALFLMVVSNSCVNPLIYGRFIRVNNGRREQRSFC